MPIKLYDTESKSRNALASPLGEEGHEVAKECTRVRMIMILDVDVTAERRHYNTYRPIGRYHNPRPEGPVNLKNLFRGGRRLAVRTAMEHPIGALPRTPFPASRDFPSRGNEKIGGTRYCVTYDTDSKSRNAPCVPFRGRGPRSGEGMYEGKNDYDTRYGRDRRKAALLYSSPVRAIRNPRPEGPSN